MPFVNPLHKKRQRSSSRSQRPPSSIYKHPRLAAVRYDGPSSNTSAESTSTTLSAKGSVITRRVKRGVASMLSLFGKSDRDLTFESDESNILISHNGKHAGFTHGNDSNATTIVKKESQLLLVGASHDDDDLPEASSSPPSRHGTPNSDIFSRKPSRLDLRRSASTSALYQKLQHRILNTFNNDPTVVVKPDLRSRPSLQTLQNEVPNWMQSQMSSSPSTYISSSGSSPKDADRSTPYTSEGFPSTPSSVRRYEGISLVDCEQLFPFGHDTVVSRLSTIPENSNQGSVSIRTVEATAAAKVFFEVHFKAVLNELAPRQLRKQRLEAELDKRGAPPALQYEVFQTWYKHESNSLRRGRVLSAPAAKASGPSSIAVGDFEVVKVLGKGSFGVVRLVRERTSAKLKDSLTLAKSRLNLKGIDTSRRSKRGVHKFKKEVYAMKVIRKSDMLRNGQEGHLRAERDFLVAAEGSKWIIPLLAAFQDQKFLYLVMDFCIGGDFLGLLIRHNILSEDATRWYVAEMILCIEEAHRMKWIHRDVKPDNFLITADGHLKISDFGLAFDGDWEHDQKFYQQHRSNLVEKLGLEVRGDADDVAEDNAVVNSRKVAEMFPPPGCRPLAKHAGPDEDLDGVPILDHRAQNQRRRLARSVVGTSQYMAPEVIRGDMYDGRCDWWSLGVIMYECLYGYTPFACDDRHQTKMKILKHKSTFSFPAQKAADRASCEAMDVIGRLLVEKERRLCSRKYRLNDYTTQLIAGRPVKFAVDKHHKNYEGYFVYPDDAGELKRHPFFDGIPWDTMLQRRAPFRPQVDHWEDTRYFEEETPVSDIADTSSDASPPGTVSTKENKAVASPPGSKNSQHHQEAQHIIPSLAIKPSGTVPTTPEPAPEGVTSTLPAQTDPSKQPTAAPLKKHKKKDKKRARDKILRDPDVGKTALELRREGAFMGYAYSKPKCVEDVVVEVLNAHKCEWHKQNPPDIAATLAERVPV